ncbi:MAG: hypothetical protein KKD01_04355 [Proteobacteria bacterium]|nr:hypothetical protein [Pseudomonadota bacterium]MBU1453939.1 hypothetical protein [Pseudomonadota bacterium]
MRTSSRLSVGIALFVLGMIWVPFSHAQNTIPDNATDQATPDKPTERVMPEGLTANLNVSFYSQYVWRGLELSKDSLVIFPTATIGYKGFALNLWVDLDTDFNNPPPGKDSEAKLQETDLTLTYNNTISPLKLDYTLGWIYYDTDGFYGDSPTHNQELFANLALDLPLNPTVGVYSEIETGSAWYTSFNLSHSFNVYKDWSLDVGGWVSYLYNKAEDFSAFHDGNLWTGLTIPLNSYFSVTPKIQYSFPLSSDSDDRLKANSFNGNDAQFLYGGIIFDLTF